MVRTKILSIFTCVNILIFFVWLATFIVQSFQEFQKGRKKRTEKQFGQKFKSNNKTKTNVYWCKMRKTIVKIHITTARSDINTSSYTFWVQYKFHVLTVKGWHKIKDKEVIYANEIIFSTYNPGKPLTKYLNWVIYIMGKLGIILYLFMW